MGKRNYVWLIRVCLSTYVGMRDRTISSVQTGCWMTVDELRSKKIWYTNSMKGVQPFYRKGVSKQYQNLGVIQKDAIHYVTYVIHYVAYVMHNVSSHYANSKKIYFIWQLVVGWQWLHKKWYINWAILNMRSLFFLAFRRKNNRWKLSNVEQRSQ